ncbi:MAG: hypothetical protein RMK64_10555 [Rhodovarius sp.]|nr:hypothetical protein [Rhodovarius sp.]MDW8315399.1 hypothetical protein [Rhodovarius sp.]
MTRRACLFLPLLLPAACAEAPPAPSGPPIGYAYLPQLRLDVATIAIETRTPPPPPGDLGALLQPTAAEAVAIMGRDRLAAFGTAGRALFLVTRASITAEPLPRRGGILALDGGQRLTCWLACRLEVEGPDGRSLGFAEAEMRRSAPSPSEMAARLRSAEGLLRRTAFDLNAEFEYQLRRALRGLLIEGEGAAPPPPGTVLRERL